MYHTAICEAEFFYAVAHDTVVLVSVYAEIPASQRTPVKTRLSNTVAILCARKTVNRAVRCNIVQPMTAFNLEICPLNSGHEGKVSIDATVPNHIPYRAEDVIPDDIF